MESQVSIGLGNIDSDFNNSFGSCPCYGFDIICKYSSKLNQRIIFSEGGIRCLTDCVFGMWMIFAKECQLYIVTEHILLHFVWVGISYA